MAKKRKTPDGRFKEGDLVSLTTTGTLQFELLAKDCSNCGTRERGNWTIDGVFYLGDEELETMEKVK